MRETATSRVGSLHDVGSASAAEAVRFATGRRRGVMPDGAGAITRSVPDTEIDAETDPTEPGGHDA